jgi:hypothetical protein
MATKECLDEICAGRDPSRDYCTAKEIYSHSGLSNIPIEDCKSCDGLRYCAYKQALEELRISDETLLKLKEIEILKWRESQIEHHDVGWTKAGLDFADKYAKQFSALYKKGVKHLKDLTEATLGSR